MQIVLTSCCVHEGKLEITKLNFQKFESWLLFYGEESRFSYLSKIWPLCDPFLFLDLNKCWAEEAGVSASWGEEPVAHICHVVLATSVTRTSNEE